MTTARAEMIKEILRTSFKKIIAITVLEKLVDMVRMN
jgi:hypothetical protein